MDNQSYHVKPKKDNLSYHVGIRLREERERIGITQSDAALLAGVSRVMWGRYERGAMPSAEVLLHVMGHGFDINYILGGMRLMPAEATEDEAESTLLDSFRKASPFQRQAMLGAVRGISETQLEAHA